MQELIPFNNPYLTGQEISNVASAIARQEFAGDGYYTRCCEHLLQELTGSPRVLLTPSCTSALEMCAMLCNVEAGDEVIMSSFNFVSAANAFVLRGAKIVFVDIRPDTMNINEDLVEAAITDKTKVIVAMHYGGVACDVQKLMAIAEPRGIFVVEDAAHCIGAYDKGQHLGSIGHLGTISFHATKNIHCGEGGALLINQIDWIERAEIIREKGTNRSTFKKGIVEKYQWVDIGSSFLLNELSAAFLWGQLAKVEEVTGKRMAIWEYYFHELSLLENFQLSADINNFQHNAHIFFLKLDNVLVRNTLIEQLERDGIKAYFHYVPLHSSAAGRRFARFFGTDTFTTSESQRLLRLPLFYSLTPNQLNQIINSLIESHVAIYS